MDRKERATFMTIREAIEQSIAYGELVRDAVEAARAAEPGERVGVFLEEVEAEVRRLLGELERYVEDAGRGELGTYTQFAVPLPEEVAALAASAGLDDAARWAVEVLTPLVERFEELAETAPTDELREAYAGAAEAVRNARKRISFAYDGMRDL